MNIYAAFFGTGQCDPNKDLKQFLAITTTALGWVALIYILRRLNKSSKSQTVKACIFVILVTFGIIGSVILLGAAWLGLACSRA